MRSDINITPFIDVLLVLLIIFMLLSNRMVLPFQLAREDGTAAPAPLVLELTNDGRYLLNTIPVRADSLPATLREVFAVRSPKVLYVKAGGQRLYREAIAAIDIARGAGVEIVALAP